MKKFSPGQKKRGGVPSRPEGGGVFFLENIDYVVFESRLRISSTLKKEDSNTKQNRIWMNTFNTFTPILA